MPVGYPYDNQPRRQFPARLILAAVIAGIAVIGYFANSSTNPVTGKNQHISLSREQEIALGLQSAPEMAHQFGGLSRDPRATALVEQVGARIVANLPPEAPPYPFKYHLLADPKTVNAFALPGGQIFITEALFVLLETEGQLAGVLGHETGHVLGRHSAEQMAKADLTQGLIGAAGVAASDGSDGGRGAQQIASLVGNFVMLKYGRDDELEADRLGLRLMFRAGYDPRAMVGVMQILDKAGGGGGGGGASQPEFTSTHPNPGNRIEHINAAISQDFPTGLPAGLKP